MGWSADTTKLQNGERYLVYYNGYYPIHSIQVYLKYEDDETEFTGEGFYFLDGETDTWKRCYKQPDCFRELDIPDIDNI